MALLKTDKDTLVLALGSLPRCAWTDFLRLTSSIEKLIQAKE